MAHETDGPGTSRREDPFRPSRPSASPRAYSILGVYDALPHSRRRHLRYAPLERGRRTLTDLATTVGAWEADGPDGGVDDAGRGALAAQERIGSRLDDARETHARSETDDGT